MAKTYALQVRMSAADAAAWKKLAEGAGMSLSEYVRTTMSKAAVVIRVAQRATGTTRHQRPTPPAKSKPAKVRSARKAKRTSNGPGPRGGDSGRLPAKG